VPSRPIELLIAVSILVSATHALRQLFPGREAAIAALFGLIHGLAFATTLADLGLGRWDHAVDRRPHHALSRVIEPHEFLHAS